MLSVAPSAFFCFRGLSRGGVSIYIYIYAFRVLVSSTVSYMISPASRLLLRRLLAMVVEARVSQGCMNSSALIFCPQALERDLGATWMDLHPLPHSRHCAHVLRSP